MCLIAIGAPALTSRGFKEEDFKQVVEFLDEAVHIAKVVQETTGKSLKEFRKYVNENEDTLAKIAELRSRVKKFAQSFTMPGFDNH